jgi:hypothetical protein
LWNRISRQFVGGSSRTARKRADYLPLGFDRKEILMPEKLSAQRETATTLQGLARQQGQILSRQDRIDANWLRIEKGLEQTLANSSSIIATQEQIKAKQASFESVLENQRIILDDLQLSCGKLEDFNRRVAHQTATIISYQQVIVSNQEKLDRVLAANAKILANQDHRVIPNSEKIVTNDQAILTGLRELQVEVPLGPYQW